MGLRGGAGGGAESKGRSGVSGVGMVRVGVDCGGRGGGQGA